MVMYIFICTWVKLGLKKILKKTNDSVVVLMVWNRFDVFWQKAALGQLMSVGIGFYSINGYLGLCRSD